jgi:YidC/Oxa1 family membrane protein insertase
VDNMRNMVLAMLLMALVLFGWPLVTQHFFPTANPPATKMVNGKQVPVPNPTANPAAETPSAIRDRAVVLRESPRIRVETPRLQGSIALKGARIDDLVLPKYRETIAKDSPPIRLLSPAGTPDAYFAGFGWTGDGVAVPGPDTLWTADGTTLVPGKPVTLTWTNPQGLHFAIRLTVDANYMFTVEQSVANPGAAPVAVRPYGLVSRTGMPKDPSTWTNHIGPIGVFGAGANYDLGYENLQGKAPGFFPNLFGTTAKAGLNYFDAKGGWLGFGDKYWLAALIPDQGSAVHGGFRSAPGDIFQADYTTEPVTVGPGKTITQSSHFFAGAKEVDVLDGYEANLHVAHFGKAIDWGWFEILEKPIFKLLDWLFRAVGNFGVAIILLTFLVRLLMYPVAQRQFRSMAAMRTLQPKMKALQERYKDDKETLQKEMLQLYQKEKVNPLAGCLPIFLQIPIFYALYKVLMLTIEMRHQPFALWIKDLSAPDPATILNVFGYIPINLPHMLAIGVLPVLLGITMYLQFKLNPQPMDEAQKQVFAIMPWIFMFIMAPFAAGLQLYWVTTNLLVIGQQKWLYMRHGAKAEAAT